MLHYSKNLNFQEDYLENFRTSTELKYFKI